MASVSHVFISMIDDHQVNMANLPEQENDQIDKTGEGFGTVFILLSSTPSRSLQNESPWYCSCLVYASFPRCDDSDSPNTLSEQTEERNYQRRNFDACHCSDSITVEKAPSRPLSAVLPNQTGTYPAEDYCGFSKFDLVRGFTNLGAGSK